MTIRENAELNVDDGLPVPPPKLRHRVHGALDKKSYLGIGETLAADIRSICSLTGHDLYSFRDILDFGCGSGRVLRHFKDRPSSCQLYGTDIDAEQIYWCQENLPSIQWNTNDYLPPLQYDDNTFDLIYAVSVFTHLNEEFQFAWLSELKRIAKPGATLILTVHGAEFHRDLSDLQKKELTSAGFLFFKHSPSRLKLDGLPDFYQAAYHTKDYVCKHWAAYFDIIQYMERGIGKRQDVVLLKIRL